MSLRRVKDALARSRLASAVGRAVAPGATDDYRARGRSLYVRLDVTNACNLRCRMCHYASGADAGRRRREDMPLDLFERIAEMVFPHTKNLQLACAFEPLLHPHIKEILAATARYGVPQWGLVTNGTLLAPGVSQAMIASGMTDLAVSIDSADAAQFETIRRGARLDHVLQNIRGFMAARDAAGKNRPALRINHVLMATTIDGIEAFARLCVELRAACVVFVHCQPLTPDNPEYLGGDPRRFNARRETALKILHEAGVYAFMPPPAGAAEGHSAAEGHGATDTARAPAHDKKAGARGGAQNGAPPFCGEPWQLVQINSRGDVFPCAQRMGYAPYGNLASQTLDEIWNNLKYLKLRRALRSGRPPRVCAACPACGLPSFEE